MKTIRARLPGVLFLWGFLLGMPFYHIPTFTKGPLICALIGQEKNVFEIFTQPHLWTYRPLLVLMFSTLYKLFGFHYEPYRIFASLFSGFFAVFVYLFLLELHPSRKIAFFATIIFTLTTPFLDGLWDLSEGGFYSTCLFYGAFLFFVKLSKCDGNHKLENRYTFLFLLFSLLSLLIKETTRAMAPPILFLYCYFLKANKTQWKLFWIFCGLSVLTLLPVLSAPPEPGSRAAITTPFWEVAKIAFQINVTQMMSILLVTTALPLLYYGCAKVIINYAKKENLSQNKRRKKKKSLNNDVDPYLWLFCFLYTLFYWWSLALYTQPQDFITYFSAKYNSSSLFSVSEFWFLFLIIFLLLILWRGDKIDKFFSSSIIIIFLSYFMEMTLIPIFRLEPSSRHYLVIIPFLCYFIVFMCISAFEARNTLTWAGKIIFYPLAGFLCISFSWHLFASAYNLSAEFRAIGKTEFPAWSFVRENSLKDTVVFSPADGYAVPPEYLKVASTDTPYAFYQLPRWFSSQSEFESHLRHTIDKHGLHEAKKIFYYSKYDTYKTPQDTLPQDYAPYTKIGYWYHIFTMHNIISSPFENYVKKNTRLIYDTTQIYYTIPEYFKDAYVAISDVYKPFIQEHRYFTGVYIQDNEPKPK